MHARYIPLVDMSAKSTCEALVTHWFTHYGMPDKITSDCSAVYMSNLAQNLFQALGIQHITVSPYSPSSNGRVEHLNSHFLKSIRALGKDELNKWPSYLPFIEYAQNVQHSKSLNASPFQVMYCQEPRTIFEAKFVRSNENSTSPEVNEQFAPRVKLMRQLMADNLLQANEQTMKTFNKQKTAKPFTLGDLVWRKSHKKTKGITASHSELYDGPFIIVEKARSDSVNVRLSRLMTGTIDKFLSHVNELKLVQTGRDELESKYRLQPTPETDGTRISNSDSTSTPSSASQAIDDNTRSTAGNATTPTTLDSTLPAPAISCNDANRQPVNVTSRRKALNYRLTNKRTSSTSKRLKIKSTSASDDQYVDVDQQHHTVKRNRTPTPQDTSVAPTPHVQADPDKKTKVLQRDLARQARTIRRDAVKQSSVTAAATHPSTPTAATDRTDSSMQRTPHVHVPPTGKTLRQSPVTQTPGLAQQSKILQRRRAKGKNIKYKVKFEDDSFQWLEPTQIHQTLLSEYNLKRFQKLQEQKKRRTLAFNQ